MEKQKSSNWFFGRQVALELLRSKQPVNKVWLAKNVEQGLVGEILAMAQKRGVLVERVLPNQLNYMTDVNHQGIALQLGSFQHLELKSFLDNLKDQRSFVVLLDEIQDPHNLGAIIRSAACFGCAGVIVPKWRSAPITDTVMKVSSGAAAHMPVIEISNLGVAVERLKEKGFFVYGADVQGKPIHSVQFTFPVALILGNENKGIKPVLKKVCDELVSIPQTSQIASLNVSNAAAIFFYEFYRKFPGA